MDRGRPDDDDNGTLPHRVMPNGHPTNHNLDALEVVHGTKERERADIYSMSIASMMKSDRHIICDAIKRTLNGRAFDRERTDVFQQSQRTAARPQPQHIRPQRQYLDDNDHGTSMDEVDEK